MPEASTKMSLTVNLTLFVSEIRFSWKKQITLLPFVQTSELKYQNEPLQIED